MNRKIVVSVSVLFALAGCGGGGGGSQNAGATPVPTPVPPVVVPADIQTTVPPLTYDKASQEYAFVSGINDFRAKLGLGLLAQNQQLDLAAANHLKYVVFNNVNNGGTVDFTKTDQATQRSMFHIEDASKPYFTGVQEMDRAKFAQYAGSAGEELSFGGGLGAVVALDGLVSTVYHRVGLMDQFPRDIGVAVGQDRSQTFVLELGDGVKGQKNESNFVGVFPRDGQTMVGLHAGAETPNPFPELSTSNADFPTKTGYPICVVLSEGVTLDVTTFTLTEDGQGAPMQVRQLTKSNDPNHYLAANIAFIVATSPLKQGTKYNVQFVGKSNGVALSKNWSFTTKS